MNSSPATQADLGARLSDLHALLAEGKFIEAMEEFLHDDVVLQEASQPPKVGKAFCIAEEHKLLANVAEFRRYEIVSVGIGEDKTFYEAIMEFVEKDGTVVKMVQCVVDTWRNGLIVHEHFYHD